jgi:N-acetylglutamate synthase-like GNAT family acetyltransferase
VTLPPLRQMGMGAAIVAKLEVEARAHNCRSDRNFFGRLGYKPCAPADVPDAVRSSRQFAELGTPSAVAMVKRMD